MRVPPSVADITDDWLSHALGQSISITGVARIGEAYGLASQIHRIDLSGFERHSLVVKLWSFDGPADATEAHFYRELAAGFPGRLPECHFADVEHERAILVLEHLEGRQGDVLVDEQPDSLEAVAQLFGRAHAQWWGDDRLAKLPWLRDGRTARGPEWVEDRRDRFRARHGSLRSVLANRLIDTAEIALRVGTERLSAVPATLAHGDVHLDNFLFVDDQPVLLDWAGCRWGPGLPDLAAVVFGMGSPEHAEQMSAAYLDALADHGVPLSLAGFERALGGAVLWSFVYWTLGTVMFEPQNEREEAMLQRHHADAVAMVELWAERDPELFDTALG